MRYDIIEDPEYGEIETWFSIRGNSKFLISNKYRIVTNNANREVISDMDKSGINISLYDMKPRLYDKRFLWRLSSTSIFIHPSFVDHVNHLDFLENCSNGAKDPFIPYFKTPQTLPNNPNLRFVPGNSYLLVSNTGEFYFLGKDLKLSRKEVYRPSNRDFYPVVNFTGKIRYSAHRLVAITWCLDEETKMKGKLFVVDHINADKQDFRPENLRWATYSENTTATKLQGVHPNNRPVLVRNIETKEVTKKLSISDASVHIGRSKMFFTNVKLKPGKIWSGTNGHFEIKYENDKTDWVYDELPSELVRSSTEMDNNPLRKHGTIIKITIPGMFVRVFKSFEDLFINFLKEERTLNAYRDYEKVVKRHYPNAIIETVKDRTYEARNYNTGNIETGPNLSALGKKIGMKKSTITKYCTIGKIYNGWFIRLKNPFIDVPWPDLKEELPENTTRQYEVFNVTTKEVQVIPSLRKLATFFGKKDRGGVRSKIDTGIPYQGWIIREIGRTRQDLSTDNKRSFKDGSCIRKNY